MNKTYLPFSIRNKRDIDSKALVFKIPKSLRDSISRAVNKFDFGYMERDETNWCYNTCVSQATLEELSTFYTPKYYNENNEFVKAETLGMIILHGRPYCVLDVIELFSRHVSNPQFDDHINAIFSNERFRYNIKDGYMADVTFGSVLSNQDADFEKGAKELIDDASTYFNNGDKQTAIEKLWDALERIKTVFPGNKRQSSEILLDKMAHDDTKFRETFATEIKTLTEIGNNFRIRHHETDKVEISHSCDLDYFYHRCAAFINLAIQYLP